MSARNIATIQTVYAAFGRGDVATILDQVTDDVDWASEPAQNIAPWHGVHRGKDEVPKFFEALGSTVEVTEFTPLAFASSDNDVMTVVRFGMRVPRPASRARWTFTTGSASTTPARSRSTAAPKTPP